MTCREKLKEQYPDYESLIDHITAVDCPEDHVNIEEPQYCDPFTDACEKCWNRKIRDDMETLEKFLDDRAVEDANLEIPRGAAKMMDTADDVAKPRPAFPTAPQILDSGDRTQFETGAVRDMREGKGRCDLMPLEVVAGYICDDHDDTDYVLYHIREFQKTNSTSYLYGALDNFDKRHWNNMYTMFLEVAKHFEEGAKKYGENNWQKGIPTHCYIDSAVRHYLKWKRGDKDEPHDRAFVWNLMCCIWEVDYHKENSK